MPIERISHPDEDLPLWSLASTRAFEAAAAAALPPHTLMRRAGAATAQLAVALAPHARRLRVYAGPGNNGGDGLEAAFQLRSAGHAVEVVLCGGAAALPADAAASLARARDAGVAFATGAATPLAPGDLAIDALLGIGARRAPDGALAAAVAELAALRCRVLAVDLPSGLDADTGRRFGEVCVRAHHTLALLTAKPGLFTAAGRDQAGDVWLDRLGIVPGAIEPAAQLAGAWHAVHATRRHDQHKGSFGDVAIVGGAPGMRGAALLAARAAHAAGAGRVHVQTLDGGDTADAMRPELMFRPHWSDAPPALLGAATVVCGCGGGNTVAAVLPRLLSLAARLVLDADALNVIAVDPALQALLHARAGRDQATVLTPHPLEAARLLGCSAAEVQADRLAAARRLSEQHGSVVLLKGSGSVIAAPGRTPWINPTGNAALASAGTGDVLAGWIGGTWAQSHGNDGALRAALAAAWRHGDAADHCGRRVLRAADLIDAMAEAAR